MDGMVLDGAPEFDADALLAQQTVQKSPVHWATTYHHVTIVATVICFVVQNGLQMLQAV